MNHRAFYRLASVAALFTQVAGAPAAETVDYNRDIRPILSENCFECHGNDAKHREAKLRLDRADSAYKTRHGLTPIVPGKPDKSEVMALITSPDPEEIMPPVKSGKKLSKKQIDLIRRWIAQGASYQKHWAFVKPKQAPLPEVKQKDWPRNPIDHFVLARLEKRGLKPSPEADRYTLIRRLSLDLTGLPPTPKQTDAFVNDPDPKAYEKLVDRLLASPRYGERWAQMWLDLGRYADTMGYEKDKPRTIWPWRDWVIDAFNNDMPFDRFTVEQLAGDLLPEATTDQILATAFHRNTLTNEEGGTDNEEFRVAAVKDRVDTTVQVWMGLTMGCAKCHSHKYDPISQTDYYRFYAYFNQTADADRGDDAPTMTAPTIGRRRQRAAWQAERAQLAARLNRSDPPFLAAQRRWEKDLAASDLWSTTRPIRSSSKQGATLKVQADDSVLVSGKLPPRDTYTIELKPTPGRITAIRLEALTDSSLGRGGPGRNQHDPNFVINDLKLSVTDASGKHKPVVLKNARADFSQKNWPVAGAIDGKPKTGWAISPQFGKPHTAIFETAEPLSIRSGTRLTLTLRQHYGKQLVLGRFRVSVSSAEYKKLSPETGGLVELASIPPAERTADQKKRLTDAFTKQWPETAKLSQKIEQLDRKIRSARSKGPKIPIMRQLPKNKRRTTKIHRRGNFLDPTDTVTPAVPAAFGTIPAGQPDNRLGVAQWLVHPDNPLTGRVQANRFWARLFGTGLVLTEGDFGNQGMPPTHPQLLDWLAVELVQRQWSVKSLLKLMVTSATYRQSSHVTADMAETDPNNRWLSRAPRFRLEAETIRDQALAAAGLLSDKMYGPSVMPPQPPGIWKITYSGADWKNATGEDRYRRGLYTYWRRTSPYPSMLTFDAGSREVCVIRRVRTNTPLQALVTLNDPVFVEAAGALALRMASTGADEAAKAEHGFRRAAVRPPRKKEIEALVMLHG
ncbi:MAG: PSD1 and planctomycete cytochrome C domain-containing protein, partial [Phycisphaeraceae bacterium]|nr:PSD1 and planctomycete cytochrome C domain-containing protein [Phycisphaeraceae bacterium]